ncbi:MAG TPA: RNA polymerase sigma factor [Solirubrobacteraceae bacterium]|nr:RNA polymerase sigma factor [Solirubrobacteraceae bacterium]
MPVRNDVTDASLIAESLSSPQSFSAIFDRHFAVIHGYLARRVGAAAADDLAAETFVIAFERRPTFSTSAGSARPWLFGIATNLLRNQWRADRRADLAVMALTTTERERTATRDSGVDAHEVLAAVAALDPDQRDALLLYAWEGLSYEEIADALGVAVGTVRSRISRGRGRLREMLEAPETPPIIARDEPGESS